MSAFNTIAILTAVVFAAAGCKRQHSQAGFGPGAVVFESVGFSLLPGEGWIEHREGDLSHSQLGEVCPPVLEGQAAFLGAVIQALSMRDRSNPEEKATSLRRQLDTQPGIIKSSLKQDNFSTEAGLHGTLLEYNQKAEEKDRKWLIRTHLYLFKNSKGHCVAICYESPASKDSSAVHEMIRRTLALR